MEAARRVIAAQIEHTRQRERTYGNAPRISAQCQEQTHDPEYTGRENEYSRMLRKSNKSRKATTKPRKSKHNAWEQQQDHQNHCTIMKRRDFHNDVALSGKARVACPRHAAFRVFVASEPCHTPRISTQHHNTHSHVAAFPLILWLGQARCSKQ